MCIPGLWQVPSQTCYPETVCHNTPETSCYPTRSQKCSKVKKSVPVQVKCFSAISQQLYKTTYQRWRSISALPFLGRPTIFHLLTLQPVAEEGMGLQLVEVVANMVGVVTTFMVQVSA